ncbi:MAG: FAD-dependent oxidoreductase, partial [Cyanobacteria bacterium J06641_5]
MLAPSLRERPRVGSQALDCDVAIVGGGIVGATLACALADSGLRVAIVEAKTHAEAAARDRAYAFSLLSGRIMAGLGIWEEIFPALGKFDRIHLSDSNRPGAVKFAP